MYALFLETEAASQIDRFVAANGGDAEDIKQKCYANSVDQGKNENWWVTKCLKGDSHKEYDVNILIDWEETPEGINYWCGVDDY